MRRIADQANFDPTLDWRHQPKDKVSRAFAVVCIFFHPNGALLTTSNDLQARKRFPYLCRFENDWVVNHFLRQLCKNRRAYDKIAAAEEELELGDAMDTS